MATALTLLLLLAPSKDGQASPESARGSIHACLPWSAGSSLTEGATDYDHFVRPTGAVEGVMLFVDFPNAAGSDDTHLLASDLILPTQRWFSEASYGRLTLEIAPIAGWYRMPKPSQDYYSGTPTFKQHLEYITDALAAADSDVSFAPYELFYVVSATGAGISGSAFIGGSNGVRVDGKTLGFGATFDQPNEYEPEESSARIMIHETLHTFGLPDLYDLTGAGDVFVGAWDPMSWQQQGAHVTAWHKLKMGWLDANQIACLQPQSQVEVTLTPIGSPGGLKAAVIRTGPTTAVVAENRQLIGEDSRLCDSGILLYSVDSSIETGHGPLRILPAQTGSEAECGPLAHAPYDVGTGEVASFTASDNILSFEVRNASGTDRTVLATNNGNFVPRHSRAATILEVRSSRRLAFRGEIVATDGYEPCVDGVPITVQRETRRHNWRTVSAGTTRSSGAWTLRTKRTPATYRVVAPMFDLGGEPCEEAVSKKLRVR